MAEIVGLVTGIGTLVTTAFTIANTISTVANDLGTAGPQMKSIATDTKAIAFVLRDLEGKVSRNLRKFDSEAESVLKETIALCTSEIKNMQMHLMPLFRSKEGRRMELKQRARWLSAKSKVSTTKTPLDSMKKGWARYYTPSNTLEGALWSNLYIHASIFGSLDPGLKS